MFQRYFSDVRLVEMWFIMTVTALLNWEGLELVGRPGMLVIHRGTQSVVR